MDNMQILSELTESLTALLEYPVHVKISLSQYS
jgi:hypothetical protein